MKNQLLFVFVIVLCSCSITKHSNASPDFSCPDDQFIAGHFYNEHIIDTFFVRLMDDKMQYCIPEKLDILDWERNLSLIVKRESKLILSGNRETLLLTDHPQITGFLILKNLGDLDGDGLDEIGFIFDGQDFSSLSTYHVYSSTGKKMKEWFSFPIHESFLEDEEPNLVYLKNDSIYCREYHPELDDDREYWVRSRNKKS